MSNPGQGGVGESYFPFHEARLQDATPVVTAAVLDTQQTRKIAKKAKLHKLHNKKIGKSIDLPGSLLKKVGKSIHLVYCSKKGTKPDAKRAGYARHL